MSTEKLSELSKPVAEVVSKFGDPEAFGEREIKLLTGIQQMAYGTKFYSQEYVSALLAELEAKDKRIAELERANTSQDDHINQQQDRIDSLEKTNAGLGRRLGDAEKRLATPVRLPNKNDAEFWFGSTFQVAKFDRAVERAISAAGFKFVGGE